MADKAKARALAKPISGGDGKASVPGLPGGYNVLPVKLRGAELPLMVCNRKCN